MRGGRRRCCLCSVSRAVACFATLQPARLPLLRRLAPLAAALFRAAFFVACPRAPPPSPPRCPQEFIVKFRVQQALTALAHGQSATNQARRGGTSPGAERGGRARQPGGRPKGPGAGARPSQGGWSAHAGRGTTRRQTLLRWRRCWCASRHRTCWMPSKSTWCSDGAQSSPGRQPAAAAAGGGGGGGAQGAHKGRRFEAAACMARGGCAHLLLHCDPGIKMHGLPDPCGPPRMPDGTDATCGGREPRALEVTSTSPPCGPPCGPPAPVCAQHVRLPARAERHDRCKSAARAWIHHIFSAERSATNRAGTTWSTLRSLSRCPSKLHSLASILSRLLTRVFSAGAAAPCKQHLRAPEARCGGAALRWRRPPQAAAVCAPVGAVLVRAPPPHSPRPPGCCPAAIPGARMTDKHRKHKLGGLELARSILGLALEGSAGEAPPPEPQRQPQPRAEQGICCRVSGCCDRVITR